MVHWANKLTAVAVSCGSADVLPRFEHDFDSSPVLTYCTFKLHKQQTYIWIQAKLLWVITLFSWSFLNRTKWFLLPDPNQCPGIECCRYTAMVMLYRESLTIDHFSHSSGKRMFCWRLKFCHETSLLLLLNCPWEGSPWTNRKGHISLYNAIPHINPPTLTKSKKAREYDLEVSDPDVTRGVVYWSDSLLIYLHSSLLQFKVTRCRFFTRGELELKCFPLLGPASRC